MERKAIYLELPGFKLPPIRVVYGKVFTSKSFKVLINFGKNIFHIGQINKAYIHIIEEKK